MPPTEPRRPDAAQISVVVCTRNRSSLLRLVLDSLTRQTLGPSAVDIVVIDDGSTDDTSTTVASYGDRVRYSYQRQAGLASARNHGLFVARAPIVLFVDDDDVPAPSLLAEHVEWHRRYADVNCAILGYTELSLDLRADPVMQFVTQVDTHLFSYGSLTHGQTLDFSGFWGGRTSCKRSFLLDHGVFDYRFAFGCEDIELAFRLSKHGLRVIYNHRAVTTMVRVISVSDFCARLWRQGRSNYLFGRLHDDPAVRKWTEADRFNGSPWTPASYGRACGVAQTLDQMTRRRTDRGLPLRDDEWNLLHAAYREAFAAAKQGGFLEAQAEDRARAPESPAGNRNEHPS